MSISEVSDKTIRLKASPPFTWKSKLRRGVWHLVWLFLFRPTPRFMYSWRRFILGLFGAELDKPVYIYASVRIWAPWNLQMGKHSTLGDNVDCYCVDKIRIGAFSTISQYSYLCAASHDYSSPSILHDSCMPLTTAPISVGERVWVAADVFIAPGITIGDGVVVFARSSVFNNLPPWVVASGHPALAIKKRSLRGE